MYFVIEYVLFAAKALTVAGLCLLPLVLAIVGLKNARRHSPQPTLGIEYLNDLLLDRQLDINPNQQRHPPNLVSQSN